MREQEVIELGNGIRLVHRQLNHIQVAHIGVMLDVGSRDETPEQQGLAHFWEHMAFKGTQKRKAYHIINRLESLGGELNAYTTKEKICFHSSVLSSHLDKSLELLSDITFNSIFPEKQIEKERMIILEEMAMYRDTPEDAIQDEFDEIVFKDHSLGMNILGNEKTISNFGKEDFRKFLNENIDTGKVIISSVGNYPLSKIKRYVERYFGDIKPLNNSNRRSPYAHYKPAVVHQEKHISQVHYIAGIPTFPLDHKSRIPFFMLTNILGGPAMNSRLNLSMREKYGYVYGVEAHYTPFTDSGLFSIMFATDPKNLKKCKAIVIRELKKLKSQPLGSLQLHKAKLQIKGQLAMSEENNNAMMLMMAKSLLDRNEIPSLPNVFKTIDAISSAELCDVASEVFNEDNFSSLTFLPA